MPTFATGFEWYSQGTILRAGRLGSVVEVKRIQGPIFNGTEAEEEHGLKLATSGLTNDLDGLPTRRYRSPGGKNEKEDVASRGVAFGRLSRRRMRNASRHGGRYTEPRESLEKGQSPDRARL